jgi:fimbrial chaperone protein
VLVTPAVFTIPANGSQVLRVALRRDAEATTELSYRLILTEVPPQPAPGFTGLNVALQVSLPVFVAAKAPTKPQLEWSAAMTADGGIGITARNAGNEHARVLDFSVAGVPGGNAAIEQQVVAYVLPGQSRTWNLASNKNNNETSSAEWRLLRVKGTTEEGDFEAETSLGRE